jgi:hypothetical protein
VLTHHSQHDFQNQNYSERRLECHRGTQDTRRDIVDCHRSSFVFCHLFLYCLLLVVSCCWFFCCCFCCVSTRRTRGRDLGCHRNNNSHRFLPSTIDPQKISRVDYGFCTNFIVYARDFEVREEKKVPRHVRTRKKRQLSFSFRVFSIT